MAFAVLVLLAVGTTAMLSSGLWGMLPGNAERLYRCVPQDMPTSPHTWGLSDLGRASETPAMPDCLATAARSAALTMILPCAVLAVLAAVLFWTQTWYALRRLVPLEGRNPPGELDAELRRLVTLAGPAGFERSPVFLIDTRGRLAGARVIGRLRRHYVCLDAGLLLLFTTDRRAFRAIVLHELAHLRNGDVPVTYLTIAVWRAFVLVLLGFAIVVTWLGPWREENVPRVSEELSIADLGLMLNAGSRVAALSAVILLARNAVLRVRELYADAQAARWNTEGDLTPLFGASASSRRWSWAAPHPHPDQRLRAMREPRTLLRPSYWMAATTGMAIALLFRHLVLPAFLFLAGHHLLYVALTTGLFGLAVGFPLAILGWRARILAGPASPLSAHVLPAASCLAAGMAAGHLMDFSSLGVPSEGAVRTTAIASFSLACVIVLVAGWVAGIARSWTPTSPRLSPLYAVWATAAAAGLLITTYAGWWARASWPVLLTATEEVATVVARFVQSTGGQLTDDITLLVAYAPQGELVAFPWAVQVCAVLSWLLPLVLARSWLRGSGGRTALRGALVRALVGAAGALAVLLALRISAPAAADSQAGLIALFHAREATAVLVIQGAISAVVVASARPHAVAVGLFAGHITGLMAAGLITLTSGPLNCLAAAAAPAGVCRFLPDGASAGVAAGALGHGVIAPALGVLAGIAVVGLRSAARRRSLRSPARGRYRSRIAAGAAAAVACTMFTVWPTPKSAPASAKDRIPARQPTDWILTDFSAPLARLHATELDVSRLAPFLRAVGGRAELLAVCSLIDSVARAADQVPTMPWEHGGSQWSTGVAFVRWAAVDCVARVTTHGTLPPQAMIELHKGEWLFIEAKWRMADALSVSSRLGASSFHSKKTRLCGSTPLAFRARCGCSWRGGVREGCGSKG
ncbi:M48 family metalloprotease [Streptomyces sp. NPDC053048]|uniref:M48 family metalloprotease n=1 Tax=Streptomyces sp. NPDC053048 TaxID=3365694 RepID=UPI0037D902E4